jgi:hypothetical protein
MRQGDGAHKAKPYAGGFALDRRLDPWIHSLVRRALKKREYLRNLTEYCGIGAFMGVSQFQNYVRDRMARAPLDGLLRLSPATKLEQLDPMHRDFEHVSEADGRVRDAKTQTSKALLDWIADNGALPFFLYLEGHPICTATHYLDANFKMVNRVAYGWDAEVRQVWIQNRQLVARGVFDRVAPTALTTTFGCTKPGEAFVWLRSGELFIHKHVSGQFHHSSFDRGHKVRCAGTITVTNGVLERLDNNSGHYQPPDRHYLTLLRILEGEGVTNAASKVGTHGIHDTADAFAGFASLPLSDYNQRAAAKQILPFAVLPEVLNRLRHPG